VHSGIIRGAMASEKQLREALMLAFQHLQSQYNTISSLMAEIAAVRDSLREIGPKYDEVLTRHRARHVKAAKSAVAEDFAKFERIIQQLRDDKLNP